MTVECETEKYKAKGSLQDVQFVGETSVGLNRYISGYLAKSEGGAAETALSEFTRSKSQYPDRSIYSDLMSLAHLHLKSRDQGAYEADCPGGLTAAADDMPENQARLDPCTYCGYDMMIIRVS